MEEHRSTYTVPRVTDHGTLVELTQACAGGSGGDAAFPSGTGGGIAFGTSSPAFGCTSD